MEDCNDDDDVFCYPYNVDDDIDDYYMSQQLNHFSNQHHNPEIPIPRNNTVSLKSQSQSEPDTIFLLLIIS